LFGVVVVSQCSVVRRETTRKNFDVDDRTTSAPAPAPPTLRGVDDPGGGGGRHRAPCMLCASCVIIFIFSSESMVRSKSRRRRSGQRRGWRRRRVVVVAVLVLPAAAEDRHGPESPRYSRDAGNVREVEVPLDVLPHRQHHGVGGGCHRVVLPTWQQERGRTGTVNIGTSYYHLNLKICRYQTLPGGTASTWRNRRLPSPQINSSVRPSVRLSVSL